MDEFVTSGHRHTRCAAQAPAIQLQLSHIDGRDLEIVAVFGTAVRRCSVVVITPDSESGDPSIFHIQCHSILTAYLSYRKMLSARLRSPLA